MIRINKEKIIGILKSKLWILAGYILFLIISTRFYLHNDNFGALMSILTALLFLIVFAGQMSITRTSVKNYQDKISRHFKEVFSVRDSPQAIASGFAIGTAIAVLPTFGLGAIVGIFVVLIFKKISKIALFAAFIIWNAFILTPLAVLEFKIGGILLKNVPTTTYKIEILNELFVYSRDYLLGNLIITILATILSYWIIYALAKKYQEQYRIIIKEPLEEILKKVGEKVQELDEED
ncbi:MAG: DUF2062 domain-containing protein [Nanoarchaeota archaeon]